MRARDTLRGMIDAMKILRLESGGSVELKVTGNFFSINDEDREFILSLGRFIDGYHESKKADALGGVIG